MKEYFNKLKENLSLPALTLLSFGGVIILGACLLQLPIFNNQQPASFIDNLFTAVSATCVTGLLSVNVANQYNIFGQLIVLLMIQIGGIGLMSFVYLIVVINNKKLNHNDRLMIQSSFNKIMLNDIVTFLKRIFKYTLTFEAAGALLYAVRFIADYGFVKGVYYSIFLAISAFCNAGIDPFTHGLSLIPYNNDLLINLVTSGLIICGGLGFIVWFDLVDNYRKYKDKKTRVLKRIITNTSLHSRLVLQISFFLIILGMGQFLIVEYNSLGDIGFGNKLLIAFFQSVSYRTAGFCTCNFSLLSKATLLFACLFMIVGGSVGGTAGGFKVSSLAVVYITIREYFKGHSKPIVQKKSISSSAILRCYFTISLYIITLFMAMFLLCLTNSDLEFTKVLFEAVSAIGTVGLSANLTSCLSLGSKIIIILLMFWGRVGMLAISNISMVDLNSAIEYADSGIVI